MIPNHLRSFFWDIDCSKFQPGQFPEYTILRVLEYGDSDAVKWLRESFSSNEISTVIRTERRLSAKSAHFWSLVFGIPEDQVGALRRTTPEPCPVWSRR